MADTPTPKLILDPESGEMKPNPLYVEDGDDKSDADTASIQRRAGPAVPSTPPRAYVNPNLQPFVPEQDVPPLWLKKACLTLKLHHTPEEEWAMHLGSALSGSAAALWDQLIETDDDAVGNYDAFKTLFTKTFVGEANLLARHIAVLRLTQGHRPGSAYIAEFRRACMGLTIDDFTKYVYFSNGLNQRELGLVAECKTLTAAITKLNAAEFASRNAPSTSSGYRTSGSHAPRVPAQAWNRTPAVPSRKAQLNAIASSAASFPADKRLTAELREYYEINGCKYCRTTEHLYVNCRNRRNAISHVRAAENGLRQ
jgi:hypothetical protein